jgi:UDP-glucose 4-epimerase
VVGDLRDPRRLLAAIAPGTAAAFHFAARSIVSDSLRDPLGYWEHNLSGAIALLRALAERGVRRFVLSSTAAVYGEPTAVPIPESAPALPTHAYGGSKLAIERLLGDAERTFGMRWLALRYFNAAGASAERGEDHQPETHLVPRLLRWVQAGGEPPPLHGDDYPTPDGTCIRDYVHVEDLATAHVRALAALDGGFSGPVNLGSGSGHSVREIWGAVERVTGVEVPVTVTSRRPGDPPVLVANIARARRELEWRPGQPLEAIVASAWRWMQAHPQGYRGGHGAGRGGQGPGNA